MAAHSKGVLNIGALPFSECNERLPLVAIQRPTGANAILLRNSSRGAQFVLGVIGLSPLNKIVAIPSNPTTAYVSILESDALVQNLPIRTLPKQKIVNGEIIFVRSKVVKAQFTSSK